MLSLGHPRPKSVAWRANSSLPASLLHAFSTSGTASCTMPIMLLFQVMAVAYGGLDARKFLDCMVYCGCETFWGSLSVDLLLVPLPCTLGVSR